MPCPADFQIGSPIYSAKSVRFKMGHPKASLDATDDEMFVWTYTSPEFPMSKVFNISGLSTGFPLHNFCLIDFLMPDMKNEMWFAIKGCLTLLYNCTLKLALNSNY